MTFRFRVVVAIITDSDYGCTVMSNDSLLPASCLLLIFVIIRVYSTQLYSIYIDLSFFLIIVFSPENSACVNEFLSKQAIGRKTSKRRVISVL